MLVLLHSPLFCEKGTTVSTHILYYKLKMAPNVFVMEKHLCPLAKLDLITRSLFFFQTHIFAFCFPALPLSVSLLMQASHQLRFLREWAVFGRALRRSVWELLGVALALLLLVLAYSHTGHLVSFFSSLFILFFSGSASPPHTHVRTPNKL